MADGKTFQPDPTGGLSPPASLLRRFQARQLPHEEWTHRAHLQVAACYLRELAPQQALPRLREEIQHLNVSHGVMTTRQRGYHETMTRVWLCLVLDAMERLGPQASLEEVVDVCAADKTMPLRFYSRDRLMSWEARIGWSEPDLQALPHDPGKWEEGTPALFTLAIDDDV